MMVLHYSKERIFNMSGLLLLALMMIFQAQWYLPKIILLGMMFLTISKFKLSNNLLFFYGVYLVYGLWGILIGLLNGTKYPFSNVTTVIFWPTLALPIIAQLKYSSQYIKITKVLFYVHLFLVVYDLVYAYSIICGFYFPNIYGNNQIFSFYETSSRLGFINLNILTFTAPVFFLIWLSKFEIGVSYLLQSLTLLLTFFLFILSGRRSLMLLFIAIPSVALFLKNRFPKEVIKKISWIVSAFILFLFLSVFYTYSNYPEVFYGYMETFKNAFDSDVEPVKFAQQRMLISEFMKSPLWGHGVGVDFYEPFPGRLIFAHQFELQYHLKLAQTGLIGFVMMGITYFGIFFYGLYLSKIRYDSLFFFFLIGYFFVLIADATNPVMCSFDLMIPFFLCLAKINSNNINEENCYRGT